MDLPLYQIDAFTMGPFTGNPAAVVPLEDWLDDMLLQAIALENNLSETAFFVPSGEHFELRWFTPAIEVELCGHATLAAAAVIFEELDTSRDEVYFRTRSGQLAVRRAGELYRMSFPRWELVRVRDMPEQLIAGLGMRPVELLRVSTRDNWFAVFATEEDLSALTPDFRALQTLHPAGVAVTAPGKESDYSCRYFAPSYGVDEDPGTGSIQCGLAPYWASRLGRQHIHSRQVSARGAEFFSEVLDDSTVISGRTRTFLRGQIAV